MRRFGKKIRKSADKLAPDFPAPVTVLLAKPDDARGRSKRFKRLKRPKPSHIHRYQTWQVRKHQFLVQKHRRGPDVRFCHKKDLPGLISQEVEKPYGMEVAGTRHPSWTGRQGSPRPGDGLGTQTRPHQTQKGSPGTFYTSLGRKKSKKFPVQSQEKIVGVCYICM